jgi:hypothetical protein
MKGIAIDKTTKLPSESGAAIFAAKDIVDEFFGVSSA